MNIKEARAMTSAERRRMLRELRRLLDKNCAGIIDCFTQIAELRELVTLNRRAIKSLEKAEQQRRNP